MGIFLLWIYFGLVGFFLSLCFRERPKSFVDIALTILWVFTGPLYFAYMIDEIIHE